MVRGGGGSLQIYRINTTKYTYSDRSYDYEIATIIGWGRLTVDGQHADLLREARVPIIQQDKCREETK